MPDPKPLTIVQLTASNVKRLKAVQIKPDGSVVVLGGRNGQGKSSVLDAITYALGGGAALPREPLRRGAEKGEVEIDLGELVVRRTFTAAGGGSLTVATKDGARYPSPQAVLDKLTGALTFDPLTFSRQEPKQQAETLRRLLGLDFTSLEAERARLYAQRTTVNNEGKGLRARFDASPRHEGVPAAEQSTGQVLAEQEAAQARNNARREQRRQADAQVAVVETLEENVAVAEADVQEATEALERARQRLAEAEAELQRKRTARDEAKARLDQLASEAPPESADEDLAAFRVRLQEIEATNRKVRENAARAALETELEAKRKASADLTARIEQLDAKKASEISAAPMPVKGLGFDAEGFVTFDGLPFEQASQAEQLRVSVAVGLAMNPRLRVLLIRDASLLDEDGLKTVATMAAEAGGQVWLEVVEAGGQGVVVIEDGQVVAREPAATSAEA